MQPSIDCKVTRVSPDIWPYEKLGKHQLRDLPEFFRNKKATVGNGRQILPEFLPYKDKYLNKTMPKWTAKIYTMISLELSLQNDAVT